MQGDDESGATLPQSDNPTLPTGQHVLPASTTGYHLGERLGLGGMGEVVLAHDPRIDRDVALKRLRGRPDDAAVARFLREAKIQARLDHPAIVPVHEIGHDDAGLPFFTMKRLTGTTLAAALESGATTQQRQLRVLAEVCLAVELAHSRGVVHRDLKPSNIMLGDFGEVYVIDWGVARVLGEDELPRGTSIEVDMASQTSTGQILGTPGYMAPEQIHNVSIGPKSDVYALGAILFEILAGEPLHPRGAAALTSTLSGTVETLPSKRRGRAVPLELEAACVAALAQTPAERPSARELGDQIQRYLDGDRDLERRSATALQLVAEGQAALAAGDRARAVRLGGRALALDPNSTGAAGLVMSLVLGPLPTQVPPDVAAAMHEHDEIARRDRSRRALIPYGVFFLLSPLSLFVTVASWPQLLGVLGTVGLLFAFSIANWRTGKVPVFVPLVLQVFAVVMFSRLVGPFMLTPVMICGILISATAVPWLNDRPHMVACYSALLVLAPFAAEAIGLLPPTWKITGHAIIAEGTVFHSSDTILSWTLFVGNLAVVVLIALYARAVTRDRRIAQRDLHLREWLLQQLLPQRTLARAKGQPSAAFASFE